MSEEKEKQAKQVIVWRNDLKVRTGKRMAQASHASLKVFLDIAKRQHLDYLDSVDAVPLIADSHKEFRFSYTEDDAFDKWLNGSFTKIVVRVDSEKELFDIYNKALVHRLPTALVVDNGKTEFNGVPTPTCCAIGPAWEDEVNAVTGHLELM